MFVHVSAQFVFLWFAGVVDNSGIRVHYTANLRASDGGVLVSGMNMNWTTLIPPYQESFTTYGHCGGFCTQEVGGATYTIA